MKTKDNITYDTLVSHEIQDTSIFLQKEQPFLFYSSETFRTVIHPETGDTFYIDGVYKPVPLDKPMTMESDFILPCDLPKIGDTSRAETFIEVPVKKDYSVKDVKADPSVYVFAGLLVFAVLIIPATHIVMQDVINQFTSKLFRIWKYGEYC